MCPWGGIKKECFYYAWPLSTLQVYAMRSESDVHELQGRATAESWTTPSMAYI